MQGENCSSTCTSPTASGYHYHCPLTKARSSYRGWLPIAKKKTKAKGPGCRVVVLGGLCVPHGRITAHPMDIPPNHTPPNTKMGASLLG